MALGILARKMGMTRYRTEDGSFVPVTVLQAGPCIVVAKRSPQPHGYTALQLGFEAVPEKKQKRLTKARLGHCLKAGVAPQRVLQEFAVAAADGIAVGQAVTVAAFHTGDLVTARASTKGRGFQGVIKRCGKHGGPGAHGSHFHRSTGSIGMRTWPGRTLKNTGMPGQMGDVFRSTRHLEIVAIDEQTNILMVRGSVPGAKNGLVRIECPAQDFAARLTAQAA